MEWTQATATSPRAKRLILFATMLALFVSAINQTVVSAALPTIVSELGGLEQFSWVFTAFDGDRLSDPEMLGFCLLLLVARNETTNNLRSNLLHLLGNRPGLWKALGHDRSLIPLAVEAALRYDSPVQGLRRTTTRPVTVGGLDLPEGSRVMVCDRRALIQQMFQGRAALSTGRPSNPAMVIASIARTVTVDADSSAPK